MKKDKKAPIKGQSNLFAYFQKVKDPEAKKESMSAIIEKTSTYKLDDRVAVPTAKTTTSTTTIDLTEEDDVLEMPSLESTSSQRSLFSFSSQSREREENETMTNDCKYNRKGWSAKDKVIGHRPSAQDPSALRTAKVSNYDRIVLKKPRITPKPNMDWLGPNDIKPYSSNYNPYIPPDPSALNIKRPEITIRKTFTDLTDLKDGNKRNWDQTFDSPITSSQNSNKPGWEDSYGGYSSFTASSSSAPQASWEDSYESIGSYTSNPTKSSQPPKKKSGWEDSYATPNYSSRYDPSVGNKKGWSSEGMPKKSWNSDGLANVKMEKLAIARSKEPVPAPDLSPEQQRVFHMVVDEGKSLFFTGSAGTGKSVLLRAIIDTLGSRYGNGLAVTASTGIAACNINGCTLHSFAGIGLGEGTAADLASKINYHNKKAKDRWCNTQVLIIDEISMVDADLFDKLNVIAKTIRGGDKPFGGLQLVVTGDFFQLPPVDKKKLSKFAFEAASWQTAITTTVMLSKVFRQKDSKFIRYLNEMRTGLLSQEAIEAFKLLSRKPPGDDGMEPTELYSLRSQVDKSNKLRLGALPGEVIPFKSVDTGDVSKLKQVLAPEIIELKLNAQVMLLKNIDNDLVNGSVGIVVGFAGRGFYKTKTVLNQLRTPQRQKEAIMDDTNDLDMNTPWPIIKFPGGREVLFERESWALELPGGRIMASRKQIPLMLAWAISIHKSQGQTLEKVKVDLGSVFEKGQAYVALSRATSLDRLQILNFSPSKVMAHPTVTKFYKQLQTV